MTYIIAQPCVDLKDRACIDECPVDCIYEGSRSLYIHPEECVDCGACEPVCPVEAIFYESTMSRTNGKPTTRRTSISSTPSDPPEAPPRTESSTATTPSSRHCRPRTLTTDSPRRTMTTVNPFRVAIVGAGPAGIYAADLLATKADRDFEISILFLRPAADPVRAGPLRSQQYVTERGTRITTYCS